MARKKSVTPSAFKSAIETTKEMEDALKNGNTVSSIKLSLISSPKTHDRNIYDEEEIKELAQSIKNNGLIQPIVVRKSGEMFERLVGFKRIMATKLNGDDVIDAIVLEKITDSQAALITISENLFRKDPNVYDQIFAIFDYMVIATNLEHKQIKHILYKHKKKIELTEDELNSLNLIESILNDKLSIGIRTFMDKLRVLDIHTLLIQAIQERKIEYKIAMELNKIKETEAITTFIKNVIDNDLSLKDVRLLIGKLYKTDKTKTDKTALNLLSTEYRKNYKDLNQDNQEKVKKHLSIIDKLLNT